jgi:hypothetical protein
MLFVALMGFVGTGCKKDPCKDVTCQNGGVCNDGTCQCATGYQGTNCETEVRAKFIAVYNAQESSTVWGNSNFEIVISSSANDVSKVIISNFYASNATVVATVSGNSMTIANQTVNSSLGSITVSGSGQLSGNILTLTYTVSQGSVSDPCTAICTKQ